MNNNEWTTETIFLDQNASGDPVQPFAFRFLVSLVDLEAITAAESRGIEITLVYEYTRPDGRGVATRRTLRTVRSAVPSY